MEKIRRGMYRRRSEEGAVICESVEEGRNPRRMIPRGDNQPRLSTVPRTVAPVCQTALEPRRLHNPLLLTYSRATRAI